MSVFTKDDYNSGDGMLTAIWGPPMWHTLHTISFNYPVKPSKEQKEKLLSILFNTSTCSTSVDTVKNYKENLKKLKIW